MKHALERGQDDGRGQDGARGARVVLNWLGHNPTNAILEGLNSVIQSMKRAARGFRNVEYFRRMIFLRLGRLDFTARLAAGYATH